MRAPLQAGLGDTAGLVSDHRKNVRIAIVSPNLFPGRGAVIQLVKNETSAKHNETRCASNSYMESLRSVYFQGFRISFPSFNS